VFPLSELLTTLILERKKEREKEREITNSNKLDKIRCFKKWGYGLYKVHMVCQLGI
jgi:hypothetical protein